jgi:LysM repeat protein
MYKLFLNGVRYPIAPGKITVSSGNKNKTHNLLNGGEFNIPKTPGLTEYSFELLLPMSQYPFAVYEDGFKSAYYYLDLLEKLKNEKKVFEYILTRSTPKGEFISDINVKVTLEDFKPVEDVKDGFDVRVSVKLKQYIYVATKVVKVSKEGETKTETKRDTSSAPVGGGTYVVKSGDTLEKIAKLQYGDFSKYKQIYEANKTVIENEAKKHGKGSSSNGHWIYPGTKLIIPGVDNIKTEVKEQPKGGSKGNPPYSIMTASGGYIITDTSIGFGMSIPGQFISWNQVYSYYTSMGGRGKGWKIVDKDKKVITV